MHNKISALTLALCVAASGFALELTPGESIIQQEDLQAANNIVNAPRQYAIATSFGKVEGKLEENNKMLELIIKEKAYNKTGLLALGGTAILSLMTQTPIFKWSNDWQNRRDIATFTIALGFACLAKIMANSDDEEQYVNDTTVQLTKNELGNWVVVNSAYDQKMDARLAIAAAAIEHGDTENTKVFAKLEKIFAAQQN